VDVQIDLVRDKPAVGRLYHVTCSNGRTFEVGLQYRHAGSRRRIDGWIDGRDYRPPGTQWEDPEDALREIVDHLRVLCEQDPGAEPR
jgi:hypothetical protein